MKLMVETVHLTRIGVTSRNLKKYVASPLHVLDSNYEFMPTYILVSKSSFHKGR
jgi:hypothetical protein